jgi:triacylglycerol lipase
VLRSLRTSALEASAFARQAYLLPRDVARPVVPRDVADGDDVVVFLHGLFASAGVLQPMRAHVGRHRRIHTAATSYPPGPGVAFIATRLASLLDVLPASARIHLVGHSLGGIVARHHAITASDERIVSTIALASPFGGIRGIGRLRFGGARDLDEESELLRAIRSSTVRLPHLSIFAGADRLTRDTGAHAIPNGDVEIVHDIGHNTVLFDQRAIDAVELRVLSLCGTSAGDCPPSRR